MLLVDVRCNVSVVIMKMFAAILVLAITQTSIKAMPIKKHSTKQ